MNAGKLEKSKRLQATLTALQAGPKTTREISVMTGSQCVHSDIAALRQNGVDILPAEYVGRTNDGSKVYQYRINAWLDGQEKQG